jgi:hypothetical protein
MAGSVVQTGSEPEPDLIETEPVVRFQVQPTPPNLTSVQFGVLSFQSKNQTEPDYGNTSTSCQLKGLCLCQQLHCHIHEMLQMTITQKCVEWQSNPPVHAGCELRTVDSGLLDKMYLFDGDREACGIVEAQ